MNRKAISINTKKKILARKKEDASLSHRKLANEFGICKSAIRRIFINEKKIINIPKESNITKIFSSSLYIVEDLLVKWINEFTKKGLIISEKIVKRKALQIYNILIINDNSLPKNFKFSNGWLKRFKKRNNIQQCLLSGEGNGISEEFLKTETEKLRKVLSAYNYDDIINVDSPAAPVRFAKHLRCK